MGGRIFSITPLLQCPNPFSRHDAKALPFGLISSTYSLPDPISFDLNRAGPFDFLIAILRKVAKTSLF